MAKSIYDVLTEKETITAVKGIGDFNMALPANMPSDTQFENKDSLLKWAVDNDCLHSVLQSGVQKRLIDLRASFRTVKKGESWNIETAQSNVDNAEWSITKRPNVGGGKAVETARYQDCIKAVANMLAAKLDAGTIHMALDTVYTANVVEGSIMALTNQS